MTAQAQAVTVSLNELKNGKVEIMIASHELEQGFRELTRGNSGSVSFETLQAAFGQDSLGILIVKDLPLEFPQVRHTVLSYASYLGNLPKETLGMVSNRLYARV
jgi:hypothetical protein